MSKRHGGMIFFTERAKAERPSGRPVFAYMIPDFSLLAAMAAFSLRAG